MARIDNEMIFKLAQQAGLSKSQAITATAVALAESGGNDSAPHPDNAPGQSGCTSAGLWQVQYCPSRDRPDSIRAQVHNDPTNLGVSAKAMAEISAGGTNWRPWTTYTKGTYRQYVQAATIAAQNVASGAYQQPLPNQASSPTPIDPNVRGAAADPNDGAYAGILNEPNDPTNTDLTDPTSPLASLVTTLSSFVDLLGVLTAGATWVRIGEFLLGLGAVAFGIILIERDTIAVAAVA